MEEKKIPGKNGEVYFPYEDRVSSESIVYFTRDLSKEGLQKAYKKIMSTLVGKIAGDMLPPLIEVGASRSRILPNPVSTS